MCGPCQANFWTSPYPYWNMEKLAPELFADLSQSSLVIFKVRVPNLRFLLNACSCSIQGDLKYVQLISTQLHGD